VEVWWVVIEVEFVSCLMGGDGLKKCGAVEEGLAYFVESNGSCPATSLVQAQAPWIGTWNLKSPTSASFHMHTQQRDVTRQPPSLPPPHIICAPLHILSHILGATSHLGPQLSAHTYGHYTPAQRGPSRHCAHTHNLINQYGDGTEFPVGSHTRGAGM
jgi:hypothetical protein